MNKRKINKIYLKNFKHVVEAEINLGNNDLVVLDGPNGFGKTTIFDAIELVITGKISRITNTIDNRLGYESKLFSGNEKVDTEVRIEFDNNGNKITIAKRIDSKKKFNQKDKRPDNWNIFQTYLLPEFMSTIEEGRLLSTNEVESILDIPNLERFFNLFYYVQQEENTLFLKKSAKERMDAISSLFDTKKEENELSIIEESKKRITSTRKSVSSQVQQNQTVLANLTTELNKSKPKDQDGVGYFQLLEIKSDLEWDKDNLNVDESNREKYLNELRSIYKLRNHLDDFLYTELNNQIDEYLTKNDLLLKTIGYSSFLENHDNYTALKVKEKSVKKLEKTFSKEEIEKKIDISNFEDVIRILQLDLDISGIKNDIESLEIAKSKMSDFSKTVQHFKTTREELLDDFKKIKQPEDSDCPLCGYPYTSYEKLLEAILSKEEKFKELADKEGKLYEEKLEDINIKYIKNINQEIKKYFSESKNIISEDFYNSLASAVKMKDQIMKFLEWCKGNDIDLEDFINSDNIEIINNEAKLQELTKYMLSKKKIISNDYKDHEKNKFIFDNIFDSNKNELRDVELDSIKKKAQYINSQFYSSGSKKVKELRIELKKAKERERKLIICEETIKNIINIYKNKIASHWRKIIRDIEIPFYIYSGKIIQNYQLGCGLFIREKDNYDQKSIMFVSSSENDHDAINYLSSGQLSGLVIAFTLALNKVYEQKALDILLIDDPVQTMDEINVASFVELLRNDFNHKQIILSTHEEDISKYIRYKFSKYNLVTKRINVKDKLYKAE
ncbi:AAA family ATPase [Enterococcus hulanensis]|uniref:AAA family ATPase n=1 Tax=Enterococcus hulanensis TaxID=2559929 RepID=UPI001A930624|nr:AAA family ATPase [Enterococcus hulanensis]MBO0411243.1 AAA family ATPase [Enterococcus hulanensis]